MMPYALARGVGTSYSVIAPVTGSSRPMRFPRCSVNQILPSGPWIGVWGPDPACGRGYSVNRPVLGSNAAILLPPCSVMYNRPSEAQAIPWGRDSGVGSSHSVNFSVFGSNRPSLLAPISANQIMPSGAATRPCGAEFGVGISYSVREPVVHMASPLASRTATIFIVALLEWVSRYQARHVVDQQGGAAGVLGAEGVQPPVDRPERGGVHARRNHDVRDVRRPRGVRQAVEVESGRAPALGAEHQEAAVGAHLHVAHGGDVRRDDRVRQHRGAANQELPHLHRVTRIPVAEHAAPGTGVGVAVGHPQVGAVALGNVVATTRDAQRAVGNAELPEPAQHVDGIEGAVVQLDAPDVGVPRAPGGNGVDPAYGEIAAQRPRDIERHHAAVVVGGVQALGGLVHPEVVR